METDKRKEAEQIPDAEPAFEDMQISDETEASEEGQNMQTSASRSKKRGKKSRTAVIVILSVLLVLIGGGVFLINYFLDKIHKIDPSTMSQLSPSEIAALESSYWESVNSKEDDIITTESITEPGSQSDPGTDPGTTEVSSSETEPEPTEETRERIVREPYQADAYRATMSADDEPVIFDHPVSYTWLSAPDLEDDNLVNIMLVGQDTRNADVRERSDTMILVSVNTKTHKVAMISFMRDLYVPLGDGYGSGRLNTAYKIGGFPFMYKVFEQNYGVHIDGGICVNFGQFMTLVDTLGGVDVTLNATEAKWLRYTIEQSVPDMRYWGQIVEAQMPTIKEGTAVKDAISALKSANLSYGYSDMNGGAAPDDIAKAKVKSLWADASCTTAAKAGRYYNLQQTIYITYEETRIAFPKLAKDISVSAAASQLKSLGFKVAYADQNGNTAPADSKAALISAVTLDAKGENTPKAGQKFEKGTKVYISYLENKANVPKMDTKISVKDAEALLKAAGLKVSWAEGSGGKAPADKSKATLTGIYLDKQGKKEVKSGDKLDVNTTVYLAYQDNTATMPTISSGTSVKDAEAALKAAGFKVAYASANKGKAPSDKTAATVKKVTTDAEGTKTAKAGTKYDKNTTLYLTYTVPEPTTEEPTTEHKHLYGDWTKWKYDENEHYRTRTCSECGEKEEERAKHTFDKVVTQPTTTSQGYTTYTCSVCGYRYKDDFTPMVHKHSFGAWSEWRHNETEHYRTRSCSCGEKEEERAKHSFNSVVTAPTTTKQGYTTFTCTVCGYSYKGDYTDPLPTEPTTEAPTTEEPTTEEPTTEAPTTEEPTTEEPTTEAPTTEEPATEEPTTEESGEPSVPSSENNAVRSNEALTAESRSLYNPILLASSSKSTAAAYEPEYLRGIKEGQVHLNGMQTLAYCRMRKLDSDFKRTERQRMVLNTLFSKVKSADVNTLINLLNNLLPQVATDMSNAEIMSIAAQVLPYFSSTQINSYSVPVNGSWRNATINGAAVIQSDQAANIEAIRSWLPY